jgi:hypothetical protein
MRLCQVERVLQGNSEYGLDFRGQDYAGRAWCQEFDIKKPYVGSIFVKERPKTPTRILDSTAPHSGLL